MLPLPRVSCDPGKAQGGRGRVDDFYLYPMIIPEEALEQVADFTDIDNVAIAEDLDYHSSGECGG